MDRVISYLAAQIQPELSWEEQWLYPAVDKLGGPGRLLPTATLRHEHRIIHQWTAELSRERARPLPNAKAFLRRADMLLGLLRAHLENEEAVLFPVLDEALGSGVFERETGGKPSQAG